VITEVIRRAHPGVVVAIGAGAGAMVAAVTPGETRTVVLPAWGGPGAVGEWQRALLDLSSVPFSRERPASAWDGSRLQIPRFDLPYGTLRWQATSGDRAGQALRSGEPSPDYFQIVMPQWAAALRPAALSSSESAALAALKG
jgi:hypothetical protein